MSRRGSKLPVSHFVALPAERRASKYLSEVVRHRGVLVRRPLPARDCTHCGLELIPAEFADVRYLDCPKGCEDTFVEARDTQASTLTDDPGYSHE